MGTTTESLTDAYGKLPSGKKVLIVTGLDSPGGGITMIDLAEKHIQDGNVYSIRRVITIPAGLSSIIFDSTGVSGKNVGIRPPIFTAIGSAHIIGSLYIGSTYTGGTIVNGINRNQKSTNTAASIIIEFPTTIPVPGTLAPIQWLIPVPTTPGVASSAEGRASENLPFIINPLLTQRIEFNNTDTNPALLEYNFTYSEREVP